MLKGKRSNENTLPQLELPIMLGIMGSSSSSGQARERDTGVHDREMLFPAVV
jgi:hypothetical protein